MPRREVLIREGAGYRLEITQGFRTRVIPVRDVRIEPDADTKRPSLVVETAINVEHFGNIPNLEKDTSIELLGPAWWRLFGGLIAAELLLVAYFAIAQREYTIEHDEVVERRLFRRPTTLKGDAAREVLERLRGVD